MHQFSNPSNVHSVSSIPDAESIHSLEANGPCFSPINKKKIDSLIRPIISKYIQAHCNIFWDERIEEKRFQRNHRFNTNFQNYSMGNSLSDEKTLEESGTRALLKLISDQCTSSGSKSLWSSSNTEITSQISQARTEACSELSSSLELQKFALDLSASLENLSRCVDHCTSFAKENIVLKTVLEISGYVEKVNNILESKPEISSKFLTKLIEDLKKALDSGSLLSVRSINQSHFNNSLITETGLHTIPRFSETVYEKISGWTVILGLLSTLGGLFSFGSTGNLGHGVGMFCIGGILGVSYGLYTSSCSKNAKKFVNIFTKLFEDKSYKTAVSIGGLLNELVVLSQLHTKFPDKTAYAKTSEEKNLNINEMRHPLLCLQQGDSVPSDLTIGAGRALFINGQNSAGKTIFSEGCIQNYIISRLGGPMFCSNASVPHLDIAYLQVPEESTGGVDIGRFETEARQTKTYATLGNKFVFLSLDEIGGGTSREEARPIQCRALGELVAKGYFVVVISHDHELIKALVDEGMVDSLMTELDENGAPTYRLIKGVASTSGAEPVLDMSELSVPAAIERIQNVGGNIETYRAFRDIP